MPQKVVIHGMIKEAMFYPEEKAFVLLVEETERKAMLPVFQVGCLAMGVHPNISVKDGNFFASQLMRRTSPVAIEFEGDVQFQDAMNTALDRVIKGKLLNDQITNAIKRSGEQLAEWKERASKDDNFIIDQLRERGF